MYSLKIRKRMCKRPSINQGIDSLKMYKAISYKISKKGNQNV